VIEGALVGGVEPGNDLAISLLALATALRTPFPRYFDLSPSRSSRLHVRRWKRQKAPRRAQRSAIENDIGFDGGIAARIDDLASVDASDLSWHVCVVS